MLNRTILFFLLAGLCGPAFAQACTQLANDEERLACFDAARACATIASDGDRLRCFDNAYSRPAVADVQDASPELTVEPEASVSHPPPVESSGSQQQPASPKVATASDEFGKKEEKKPADTEVDHIYAKIVEVTTNALRIDYLWLDNGHIWRENEDSRIRFKVGRQVRIEKGILNSFNLTMEGSKKKIKVKRVK